MRHSKEHPGASHTTCGLNVCSPSVKVEWLPNHPADCPHCLAKTQNPKSLRSRVQRGVYGSA